MFFFLHRTHTNFLRVNMATSEGGGGGRGICMYLLGTGPVSLDRVPVLASSGSFHLTPTEYFKGTV